MKSSLFTEKHDSYIFNPVLFSTVVKGLIPCFDWPIFLYIGMPKKNDPHLAILLLAQNKYWRWFYIGPLVQNRQDSQN